MNIFVRLVLPLFFLVTSCATNSERFEQVEIGMEKHDVLQVMGNPRYTRRIKSVDRWGFVYYDDGVRSEKQVHFKQGMVIYKGDRPLPAVSAEEQDKINEQQNATIAQRQEQSYQSQRAHKKGLENDYYNYMSGKTKSAKPNFEPVGSQ